MGQIFYLPQIRTYEPANGLSQYYEVYGEGEPVVLLHGGLGLGSMFGDLVPLLAERYKVITVDLQGHGHTVDINRPLRYETLGDDIAALMRDLNLAPAYLMGYSLGGGAALRTAIQHPDVVKKLVLVSTAFRRESWYPEVLANMDQITAASAEMMKGSPIHIAYQNAAPKPGNFPILVEKVGDLLRQPYDWSSEVAAMQTPTMLVFADHDSLPLTEAARFFELFGGGKRDAGWDGAGMTSARLAVIPGTSHYNVFMAPLLPTLMTSFFSE